MQIKKSKPKTGWLEVDRACSWATCLPLDCCSVDSTLQRHSTPYWF